MSKLPPAGRRSRTSADATTGNERLQPAGWQAGRRCRHPGRRIGLQPCL